MLAGQRALLPALWHSGFLKDRPAPVDRVVVVPPIRGIIGKPDLKENPYQVEQFFQSMAQEHFDLAIQVHGDGRYSNPFVRRLGARMTVGTRIPDALPRAENPRQRWPASKFARIGDALAFSDG